MSKKSGSRKSKRSLPEPTPGMGGDPRPTEEEAAAARAARQGEQGGGNGSEEAAQPVVEASDVQQEEGAAAPASDVVPVPPPEGARSEPAGGDVQLIPGVDYDAITSDSVVKLETALMGVIIPLGPQLNLAPLDKNEGPICRAARLLDGVAEGDELKSLQMCKREIDRLAQYLLDNHADAIVEGGAVDTVIALLTPADEEAEEVPVAKGKKGCKIRHDQVEINVRVPGYTPRGIARFNPARTDAAERSRLLDVAIDSLADQLK